MPKTHICEKCGRNFKQKSHLDDHHKRKRPCEKDDTLVKLIDDKVEERVNTRIMELLESGNQRNEVVNERTTTPNKTLKQKHQNPVVEGATSPMSILTELVQKNYSKLSHARNTHEVIASRMNILDSQEDLIAFIGQHLKPKEIEKKQNGEVFTPPELIKQKFDKLTEIDPSVWTDPSKKFLDPANGIGNYPALAFHRLMDGLSTAIPDEYRRKKHILEKMLYMCELNRKNVEVSKKLFDPKGEFKLNIHCGSFLELDMKEVWGIEKFDVIMGNPPYNASGTKASGNTIWQLFVKNSLSILNDNGYLVFVHPPGWRKPNTDQGKFYGLFQQMAKDNQMKYLSIHGIKDGNTIFHCGTRYDWYIIQRIPSTEYTIVNDEKGVEVSVNMRELEWLPNYKIDVVLRLLAQGNEERCPVIYNRSNYGSDKPYISRTKTDEHTYPVIHTIPRSGIRYLYSNTNTNGHYGVPKVVFGDNGLNDVIVDMSGKYATSENSMSIRVSSIEEATQIKNVLLSISFKEFINACIIGNFRIDWRLFTYFKKDFWKEFV